MAVAEPSLEDVFISLTGKETKSVNQIRLQDAKPATFGPNDERCVYVEFDGTLRIGDTADVPPELVYVHDSRADNPAAPWLTTAAVSLFVGVLCCVVLIGAAVFTVKV